jgi:ABC-type amino acid transport substrate-binding protein
MRSRTSIFSARHRTAAVAGLAAMAMLLTGCGSSGGGDSGDSGGGSSASGSLSELAAKLPKDILDRGYIQDLKQTPAAPFEFDDDKGKFTGIDVDLTARLSEVIGFPIKTDQITDFAQLIPSVQTKRADMVWSAALDKVERQQVVTIVDYFKTGSIFMLLKDSKVKDRALRQDRGHQRGHQLPGAARRPEQDCLRRQGPVQGPRPRRHGRGPSAAGRGRARRCDLRRIGLQRLPGAAAPR